MDNSYGLPVGVIVLRDPNANYYVYDTRVNYRSVSHVDERNAVADFCRACTSRRYTKLLEKWSLLHV